MHNSLRLSLFALLTSGSALAGVGTLPGHSSDAPGSNTVGAPASSASLADMWADTSGDGIIDRSEVMPGSQLEQRFATRDKNGDNRLTQDEYYYPAPAAAPAPAPVLAAAPVSAPAAPPTAASGMWVDTNADGVIDRTEVVPGSQLSLRFTTRDKNHDGRLTGDEYTYTR